MCLFWLPRTQVNNIKTKVIIYVANTIRRGVLLCNVYIYIQHDFNAVLNIVVSLISLEKGTERQRESKRKTKSDGEK